MFCVNCGEQLPEAATACSSCGQMVRQASSPPVSVVPVQRPQRLNDSTREARNSVLAEPVVNEWRRPKRLRNQLMAVALVVLIAGVLLIELSDRSRSRSGEAIQVPDSVVVGTDTETPAAPSTNRDDDNERHDTGVQNSVFTPFEFYFSEVSVNALSRTYGFLLGQQWSLELVEDKFPDLSARVLLATLEFDTSFSSVLSRVSDLLLQVLGQDGFDENKRELRELLGGTIQSDLVTREVADAFLIEVNNRAEGYIESPILETILSVTYGLDPGREFLAGHRQRFSSKGHTKARGLEIELQLPRSWLAEEGERPHIVQKWTSQNGTGLDMLMLQISDDLEVFMTESVWNEYVALGEFEDMVPDGLQKLDSGRFSLEQRTGIWLDLNGRIERAGVEMFTHQRFFMFLARDKFVSVVCGTFRPTDSAAEVAEIFENMEPLCQAVLNSVVLPQIY